MPKLHLISTNGYDAAIIEDANGARIHMIGDGEAFADALKTGDEQDISNWSGDLLDEGALAGYENDIIATNDGETLTAIDADRLAARREFWGA